MKRILPSLLSLALLAFAAPAVAQSTRPATQPASSSVTVAVFAFDADAPADGGAGGQVAEVVAALLSAEPALQLVDRASLDTAVDELELGASGLVGDRAAQAGRLVGAELLVVGRVFQMDDVAYLSARVIGTETSLVKPILVQSPVGRSGPPLGDLAREAAAKIATAVRDDADSLLAQPVADPLPPLVERARAAMENDAKSVFVRVPETHYGNARGRDPAAETELTSIFREAGLDIAGSADDADFFVEGEAFSEFGTRLGDLVSCSARVEVRLTGADGENLYAGRSLARAADLGEQTAGKLALERGARAAAVDLLDAVLDAGGNP